MDTYVKPLGTWKRPLHYLAIPPSEFETVVIETGQFRRSQDARVIVEKPFGRDLVFAASAQPNTSTVLSRAGYLPDRSLPRHSWSKFYFIFRFANSFLEPIWNRRC